MPVQKKGKQCGAQLDNQALPRKRLSATPNIYFKGARFMNSPGFLKCAGAVVALALVSACAGGSAVAPSPATVTTSYVGKTLFVNGRPVTAARLNPLPRYAELVPDAAKSKDYEYIFNDYGSYAGIFSTIRRALRRSVRLMAPAARGAPMCCTAMGRRLSGMPGVRTT